MKTQTIYGELIHFVKKPTLESSYKKNRIWDFFSLWSLSLFLALFAGIGTSIVLVQSGYNTDNNSVVDFIQTANPFTILLLAAIIAPILEELAFRLPLKFTKWSVRLGVSFFVYYMFQFVSSYIPPINNIRELWGVALFDGLLLLTTFCLLFILIRDDRLESLQKFSKNNFKYIFYASTLLFASIHIANYAEIGNIIYLAPILVLPQFVLGYILGFVRVRLGFLEAVLMHSVHNAFLALPSILISRISIDEITAESLQNISANDSFYYLAGTLAWLLPLLILFIILVLNIAFLVDAYKKTNKLVALLFNIIIPGSGFILLKKTKVGILLLLSHAIMLCTFLSLTIATSVHSENVFLLTAVGLLAFILSFQLLMSSGILLFSKKTI